METIKKKLTYERCKELFDYLPKTGEIVRKINVTNCKKGDVVGKGDKTNIYLTVNVDGERVSVHHIVWLLCKGFLPNTIDHINRNKRDNRIENLRQVSLQCNNRNRPVFKNNKSGIKGVSWDKKRSKWEVSITLNNRQVYLGASLCKVEASCMRLHAEQCLDWSGCDASSSSYQYVKKSIPTIK